MTALGLRDCMQRFGWFRALLSCAVVLLGVAVMLHHGWMGGMDHAAASSSAPATTHHDHADHGDPPLTNAASHAPAAGHTDSAGDAGTPGHAMTMAMCLAVLASGLLVPVVAFVRKRLSRRRIGARRKPRRVLRPPSAMLPSVWIPPPRGGPSLQSLLCVVRR